MQLDNWNDADKTLPDENCIVKVKRRDGRENRAYFYTDAMSWIAYYGLKTTHWWDKISKEPIYDVTHWKLK